MVAELEVVDKAIDFAIVPTLCPRSVSPYDFSRSTELISGAGESTRQWISGYGQ
jgi:NTE family protein